MRVKQRTLRFSLHVPRRGSYILIACVFCEVVDTQCGVGCLCHPSTVIKLKGGGGGSFLRQTPRPRHALYIRMFLSASSSSRTWRLDFAKAARPVHLHHELLDERLSLRAFVAQLVPLLDERREHLGPRRRKPAQHGGQVA